MILHQIAPKNNMTWHPIWSQCRETWLANFSEHMLWDDQELGLFIDQYYPEYSNFFDSLPLLIMKIDVARYAILHKFGGIYADMDMYCYSNFEDEIKPGINLVGSNAQFETVQNSLMVSTFAGNEFWIKCIENSREVFNSITTPTIDDVLHIAGPIQLSKMVIGEEISILPAENYNSNYTSYHPEMRTKHMLTGTWQICQTPAEMGQTYKSWRGVDHENFNYRKNY